MNVKEMTAPCGLACWACAYYKDNITDELAQGLSEMLKMDVADVACEGCRSESGCRFEAPLTGGRRRVFKCRFCAGKICISGELAIDF